MITYWFNHTDRVDLTGTSLTGVNEITHDYDKNRFFFSTVSGGLWNISIFSLDTLTAKTLVSNSK